MSSRAPTNMAASVHQRLRNYARLSGDDPQYVLMRYGLERLMYRLSQSSHARLFTGAADSGDRRVNDVSSEVVEERTVAGTHGLGTVILRAEGGGSRE